MRSCAGELSSDSSPLPLRAEACQYVSDGGCWGVCFVSRVLPIPRCLARPRPEVVMGLAEGDSDNAASLQWRR
ncbi:MAG: hypothetical protein ACK48U_06815, partial [Planctomyces sp.]